MAEEWQRLCASPSGSGNYAEGGVMDIQKLFEELYVKNAPSWSIERDLDSSYKYHATKSAFVLFENQQLEIESLKSELAEAQAVPYESCSIKSHEIIINETKKELIDGYDFAQEDEYLLESLVYRGVCIGKAQTVPEGFVLAPKLSANYLFNKVPELGFKHKDEKDTVLYHLNYMASEFKDSAKQFINADHAKQMESEWISVDNKEPPLGTMVLICWSDAPDVEPEKDYMDHDVDHGVNYWANYNDGDEPSHWMLLPEPVAQEQSHE